MKLLLDRRFGAVVVMVTDIGMRLHSHRIAETLSANGDAVQAQAPSARMPPAARLRAPSRCRR